LILYFFVWLSVGCFFFFETKSLKKETKKSNFPSFCVWNRGDTKTPN